METIKPAMSSHSTLTRALSDDPTAVAILFLDDTGEVIDSAHADGLSHDLSVIGAYLEIHLRKLRDVALEWDNERSNFIHFEKGQYQYMAVPLPEGYFLVIVHGRPAVVARGRRALSNTVEAVTQEFFAT